MFHDFIVGLYGEGTYQVIYFIFYFYPIWAPFLLGVAFWTLWVRFVQASYNAALPRVLLEIKAPRDVDKSPLAMEVVLGALQQGHRESNFISRYWKGSSRPWFSLEIASLGGQVHFYIWTEAFMKNFIQSQFYSQYPGVEVSEVDDYTKKTAFDLQKMDIWGMEYDFTNPGGNAYPIKTYVDYGLDKDPKEEHKVDPLSAMVEFLGNIKRDEQIWIQFVLRSHKNEKRTGFFSSKSSWKDEAKGAVQKIRDSLKDEEGRERRPTKGETDIIAAIERSVSKPAFDVGIRAVYHAPIESFDKATTSGISGTVRLYNSETLNGFKHGYETDFTKLPWEDFRDIRVNRRKRIFLDAFKRRMFFFYPYIHNTLVLNTEELATMFHVPGQSTSTPTFERIPSKKAQAPVNLPI
jgi:hypothetical protein